METRWDLELLNVYLSVFIRFFFFFNGGEKMIRKIRFSKLFVRVRFWFGSLVGLVFISPHLFIVCISISLIKAIPFNVNRVIIPVTR